MRIAISRVVLFSAGLALIMAAFLSSLTGTAAAAPPMLVTEVTTAEPPTRTPAVPTNLPAPPPSVPSPLPATSVPPAATSVPPAATSVPPADTSVPPADTPNNTEKKNPTATPTPVSAPLPQIADPAITKSVNRSTARVGDTVEFTLSVTNLGNAVANSVVVEDSLPAFLALGGASATRGDVSASGATVRVTIGALAPAETVTVTITARVVAAAAPPNNSNVATVSSSSPGDDQANNSSSAALIIEAAPPASLPNTGSSDGPGPLPLAALGLGLIAISLFARWRKA